MPTIGFILMSICAGVTGQLFLKLGMTRLGFQTISPSTLAPTIVRLVLSPWVVMGVAIYVAGTFTWLIVLSRIDLSLAYPMTSISYILIVGSSWLLLGESVNRLKVLGVLIIIAGVVLISQS
jgi:multidrug transporter EmrE-like cation transporter